jgi:hypothetical protein
VRFKFLLKQQRHLCASHFVINDSVNEIKINNVCVIQYFNKPEGLLPSVEDSATYHYPEPDEFCPCACTGH